MEIPADVESNRGGNDRQGRFYVPEYSGLSGDTEFVLTGDKNHD